MNRDSTNPGPRYQAMLQLLRTAESLWNASRTFFVRWNLSPSQFNILNLLHRRPSGSTQIELSRDLIMHRSNVTGLVDRLEARGLLKRTEDATDRRVYKIVLTDGGANLMSEIFPHYYAAAEAVWSDLSMERTDQLLADLAGVSANAERISRNSNIKT